MYKTFTRSLIFAIAASSLTLADTHAQIIRIDGGGGGFSRSVSVRNVDGVKTTDVTENGKKYLIREGDGFVEIEFAKTYGPKDLDELKENHPDLYMHVTSFPKMSGDGKVELTIAVKEIAKAETADELKEKNPEAFALFEKYTKQNGLGAFRFGGARRIDFAPKMIELKDLEKDLAVDAAKRVEEMEKRADEMRRRLLEKSKKLREEEEKDLEEKNDEEKGDGNKGIEAKPKTKNKKDLIDA